MSRGEDLINDSVLGALRGLIHTDRKGRAKEKSRPYAKPPWGNTQVARARRRHMRYTRWVRYKECQWAQLSELQMDTISTQRDILIEQNRIEGEDSAAKEFNRRLLEEIDERLGTSREAGADVNKKPLVDYDEWRVIDGCLYREERVMNMLIEGEVCGENVPRWENWRKNGTLGRWGYLRVLGLFPGDDRFWIALKR